MHVAPIVPVITKPSTAMALTTLDEQPILFYEEEFHIPSCANHILGYVKRFTSRFLKSIQLCKSQCFNDDNDNNLAPGHRISCEMHGYLQGLSFKSPAILH